MDMSTRSLRRISSSTRTTSRPAGAEGVRAVYVAAPRVSRFPSHNRRPRGQRRCRLAAHGRDRHQYRTVYGPRIDRPLHSDRRLRCDWCRERFDGRALGRSGPSRRPLAVGSAPLGERRLQLSRHVVPTQVHRRRRASAARPMAVSGWRSSLRGRRPGCEKDVLVVAAQRNPDRPRPHPRLRILEPANSSAACSRPADETVRRAAATCSSDCRPRCANTIP